MANNGIVNPKCANHSNPYHQCSEACGQKTKGTKQHPHANKKTSGYRRSVTDGELGRKRNGEKRTSCPKASNPYHKCDHNCNTTFSNSGAAPPHSNNSDKKNRVGSKPVPPVLDSVPASKVGAIYVSAASSPISNHSINDKKVELKTDVDHNASIPISGQLNIPVVQDEIVSAEQSDEERKVISHDTGEQGVTTVVTPAGGSKDFSFSGSCDEEAESVMSVISESRVPVGKYNVKESFASILLSILDKYGDIGASCQLESVAMRSYYIECVCFVVQELQSESVKNLTKSKVNELLAILKDVESAHLRVAWLRIALDEIADNIDLITHHQDVEAAKAKSEREMESLKEKLESELETLAQKEQEVTDIKTRIPEIRDRMSELQLKSSELDEGTLSIKSKLDNLHSKSSIHELL